MLRLRNNPMENRYHVAVLRETAVRLLAAAGPAGVFVDATFGGGGHTLALLGELAAEARVLGFDQDPAAKANVPNDPRFALLPVNFRGLQSRLADVGVRQVDGILADLGVSSHQFDTAARGFSFRFDGPLDMRMDPSLAVPTAADLLNELPEAALADLFFHYGELSQARRIAKRIVQQRVQSSIQTTRRLVEVLEPVLPKRKPQQVLAQVFQALRIVVNDELGALEDFLAQATAVLRPGGRLVVIAYHSLEDRRVKRWLRAGNANGQIPRDGYGQPHAPFTVLTRKAVVPTAAEIAENPRARSARLRAGERTAEAFPPAA